MKICAGLDRTKGAPFFYIRKSSDLYSDIVRLTARLWIAWITVENTRKLEDT